MNDKIKKDAALKEYWRDNRRIADLFNQIFFNGKQVIRPEELVEQDTDLSSILTSNYINESIERRRDIIKKCTNGIELVLIAIENQLEVHYAMPLRSALYDILNYLKQCDIIAKKHEEKKDLKTGSEYLSKMKKDDKLNFVLTLVICYSKEEWDGARKLSDMIIVPEQYKGFFNDYEINLLNISEAAELPFLVKDNKDLFEGIDLFYRKDSMTRDAYKNSFKGKQYSKDVLLTIGSITKSALFVKYAEECQERSVDMTAVLDKYDEDLIEEGIEKGIEKGIKKVAQKMLERKVNIEEISDFTGLSKEQIQLL